MKAVSHEDRGCEDVKGGQLFVVKNTGAQGLPGRSFDPMAQ